MTALSDAEILQKYREKRDALVQEITSGGAVKRYRFGLREKENADPVQMLRFIEEQITALENKIAQAAQTTASATNFARLRRD